MAQRYEKQGGHLGDHSQALGEPGGHGSRVDTQRPDDVRHGHEHEGTERDHAQRADEVRTGDPGDDQPGGRHAEKSYARRIPVDLAGNGQRQSGPVRGKPGDQQQAATPHPDQERGPPTQRVRVQAGQPHGEHGRARGDQRERDGQQPAVRCEDVLTDHALERVQTRHQVQDRHPGRTGSDHGIPEQHPHASSL
ncbi:hypothetical protein Mth01_19660 [Sphaerimonospora thailandensis]|uniref:Uncharacterized protein n=1 Tax=Sphaerimonospora thailandensis TaxID=795644 RepID=A0A8J3R777_9ACTN|nr:hypothetical protein Mth01_19660 [Sphaerimonospora thailandensis]